VSGQRRRRRPPRPWGGLPPLTLFAPGDRVAFSEDVTLRGTVTEVGYAWTLVRWDDGQVGTIARADNDLLHPETLEAEARGQGPRLLPPEVRS